MSAASVEQPSQQSFDIEQFLAAEESKGLLRLTTAGSVDTIYFRGGTLTSNSGGIDKITHDGVNTTARAGIARVRRSPKVRHA